MKNISQKRGANDATEKQILQANDKANEQVKSGALFDGAEFAEEVTQDVCQCALVWTRKRLQRKKKQKPEWRSVRKEKDGLKHRMIKAIAGNKLYQCLRCGKRSIYGNVLGACLRPYVG